ncbi:DNA gyrase inhibitor YacG [Candidatus Vondammii sp. HM_W22]|uniref:DNA gyrase inhibitor YacG n=1 Tax=Candidatus Vondammii sp. HM_W22 TaxID=2687299 RepID=UPI001F133C9A|nr:DNA gyrase inhibitor YacG [Candidatus Vondammii sp. HM_W22]
MTTNSKRQASCPTCKKIFEWNNGSPWRPFCSERCKLIDLGDWLDETHRIPDNTAETPFSPADEDFS